ncbi:hypothetical protein EDD18DRAFT_1132473 [Armillaria luteobubalina]|uniref:Uncharacterized protein n=1 Tax=Armillaria luteobubalina TaxID=153913 RepID=A0AA39QM87_9AGAR|nr:hypothetical protein EDD18DRAFT_1132473 [Armillaria luteobubalina]
MITNPPKEIWVRGIPMCGALRIVPLFRQVFFVATGSGIAPFTVRCSSSTRHTRTTYLIFTFLFR